jgi:hypothetical protein
VGILGDVAGFKVTTASTREPQFVQGHGSTPFHGRSDYAVGQPEVYLVRQEGGSFVRAKSLVSTSLADLPDGAQYFVEARMPVDIQSATASLVSQDAGTNVEIPHRSEFVAPTNLSISMQLVETNDRYSLLRSSQSFLVITETSTTPVPIPGIAIQAVPLGGVRPAVPIAFGGGDVTGEKEPVLSCQLLDCCGEVIKSAEEAKNDCDKELFPPKGSECCAYEFIDKLDVVYSASSGGDESLKVFLVIKDAAGQIYEKEEQFGENLISRWTLVKQDGSPLNVGRQGKEFKVFLEIRTLAGVVKCKSGIISALIDNCAVRNLAIRDLKTTPGVFNDPGFHLYIDVLNFISESICEKVRIGLVDYELANFDPTKTFDKKCDVVCVNNFFSNRFLDLAPAAPGTPNNIIASTHKKVQMIVGRGPPIALKGPMQVRVFQEYVDAEDVLRGEAFIHCDTKLEPSDRGMLTDIILSTFRAMPGIEKFIAGVKKDAVEAHFKVSDKIFDDAQGGTP